MGKGMFPTMSTADIVTSLGAWGVQVTSQELHRPTPEFVEGVYCACLYQVTNINTDALREPVQRALNQTHMVEKVASQATSHFFLHRARFAKASRVDDFCSKDIQAPERDRTLLLLSAFINFPFVTKLREESDDIVVDRERVAKRLTDVNEEIDKLKAKMAEDEPKCAQLREENSVLRARLFASKQVQEDTVEQVESLKAEKTALMQRKEALNGEISSISDSITRIRSRIVQSPERIKRTITTMSATAQQDKQTVSLHESKARDLQAKITALSNIEKDVRGCIEQLQTIEKEVQKELHDLKDLVDRKQIEHKELHLHRERLLRQLSNAQEKLERAQRHAEERKAASQKTIDRLQREYDEMVVERRDTDKQVEEVRAEANNVESKMAEHLKTSEAELNQLLSEYWQLRHNTGAVLSVIEVFLTLGQISTCTRWQTNLT
ncbi:Nuf2 family-domain-containing protein [Mycena amicta]|nr:Nuf2 family-domain-containing protein [Mycena amicta]